MWLGGILLHFMALVGMIPAGWAEIQQLTVRKGETKVLLTKPTLNLQGDSSVLWMVKPRGHSEFLKLASSGHGVLDQYILESFKGRVKLDKTSGVLTLGPLDLGDRGFYRGEITEIDGSVHEFEFNITVEESVPTPKEMTPGPLRNTTKNPKDQKDGRTHFAVIPAIIVFLVIVLAVIVKILMNKKGTSGTISSSSSSSFSSVDLEKGKQRLFSSDHNP